MHIQKNIVTILYSDNAKTKDVYKYTTENNLKLVEKVCKLIQKQ